MDWRQHIEQHLSGRWQRDVPLAGRTSLRVGGRAALFGCPDAPEGVSRLVRFCQTEGIPLHVLGGGANTIVGDGGFGGVVLRLAADPALDTEAEWIDDGARSTRVLSAGSPGNKLVQWARDQQLVGAEWASGIPGTLGGFAAMNAGTRAGELKDNVTELLLASADGVGWVSAAQVHYAYRHASLRGRIVLAVRLTLVRGEGEALERSAALLESDRDYRKRTQPLQLPNSGSVFRNPPGHAAGRLIESCGLKGTTVGGAQISEVHANFIVNRGGASAADVLGLMALAQHTVRQTHGVDLIPEVRLVGCFLPSPAALGLTDVTGSLIDAASPFAT